MVQLGYTNLFHRDHHWQNQAQYELSSGEQCCFRQIAERDGEIGLVLSYSAAAGEDTHSLFQGAFERFLKRRKVQIIRFPAVVCPEGHQQERAVIRKAISGLRASFFCDQCGTKIQTPTPHEIGTHAPRHATVLQQAEQISVRRTEYEVAVSWIKSFRRDRRDGPQKPTCFISYAWGNPLDERWVEDLVVNLRNADVAVTFDRWHNTPGTSITRFIEGIENSDFICPVGTPEYKLKDAAEESDPVVQAELRLIKTRLRKRDATRATVIPLLRRGKVPEEAFPPLLLDSVYVDFRKDDMLFIHLFELLLTLHRISFENEMARKYRAEIARSSA